MSEKLLIEAQKALGLSLISLYSSEISTGKSFSPQQENLNIKVLNKRNFDKIEASKNKIKYYYTFGVMLLPENIKNEDATEDNFSVLIEASYIAEYHINNKVSAKALQEFGETNAPYHLWTYWREYIQSTLNRMGMPPLTMPMLLPKIPVNKKTPIKAKKKKAISKS